MKIRLFITLIFLIFLSVHLFSQTLITPFELCELDTEVNETSGLINVNGTVWTHNDSGGTDRLYQINPETGAYYTSDDKAVRDENDEFTRNRAGGIVGLILGGLGCVGFGISFLF